MVEIQVQVPNERIKPPAFAKAVRLAVEELGLDTSVETSLAKFPGSLHWHLKKQSRTGTLEVSAIPIQARVWVCYHDNRIGDGWVQEFAPLLAKEIEHRLSKV